MISHSELRFGPDSRERLDQTTDPSAHSARQRPDPHADRDS